MKKLFVLAVLAAIFYLTGCNPVETTEPDHGGISVSLPGASRSLPTQDDVLSYKIIISSQEHNYYELKIGLPGQKIVFDNLLPGFYDAAAFAYNHEGILIFKGINYNIEVLPGITNEVEILMYYISGDVDISIIFPEVTPEPCYDINCCDRLYPSYLGFINTDFESTEAWVLIPPYLTPTEVLSITQIDGRSAVYIDCKDTGYKERDLQLTQTGLTFLENHTYEAKIIAKSDISRTLQVDIKMTYYPGTYYHVENDIPLTSQWAEYQFIFTVESVGPNNQNGSRININLGSKQNDDSSDNYVSYNDSKVWIDKVTIKEIDKNCIDSLQPAPTPVPHLEILTTDKLWLIPEELTIDVGSQFTTELHINTLNQKVAAYGIDIYFNPDIIKVDESFPDSISGVLPGSDGFLIAVNINQPGQLRTAGFDAHGIGPGLDLHLITINWNSINSGKTNIETIIRDYYTSQTTQIPDVPNFSLASRKCSVIVR